MKNMKTPEGNQGNHYTAVSLANTEDTQRRFGRRTEHHPEEVAEEWKQHFQAIQLGKINVPEEYWQDVLPLDTDSDWLNDIYPPS